MSFNHAAITVSNRDLWSLSAYAQLCLTAEIGTRCRPAGLREAKGRFQHDRSFTPRPLKVVSWSTAAGRSWDKPVVPMPQVENQLLSDLDNQPGFGAFGELSLVHIAERDQSISVQAF